MNQPFIFGHFNFIGFLVEEESPSFDFKLHLKNIIPKFIISLLIKIMRLKRFSNSKASHKEPASLKAPSSITNPSPQLFSNRIRKRVELTSSIWTNKLEAPPINQPESQSTFTRNFTKIYPTISSRDQQSTHTCIRNRSQDNAIVRRPFLRSSSQIICKRKIYQTMSKTYLWKNADKPADPVTYASQLQIFEELFYRLKHVDLTIKEDILNIGSAFEQYGESIHRPQLKFIDDFTQNCHEKIEKTIRTSRMHEYLSIAYIFLEIAQKHLDDSQSYLINYIGYSLSNLMYTIRLFILLEQRPEFQIHSFEKQVERFEMEAYGEIMKSVDDVLLRMQHNNETVAMIHRKLGKFDEIFERNIGFSFNSRSKRNMGIKLCAHCIFEALALHIHESQLFGVSKYLQIAPRPYLAAQKNDYTLIFEPIGIMKNGINIRSYFLQFIKWAAARFDIIMWTWQLPSPELQTFTQLIEPYLFAKLYRHHCTHVANLLVQKKSIYRKDLNRLERDLDKTLIIDYDQRIFSETPKNGIVARWKGRTKEKGLLLLSEILNQMINSESTVSEMINFYGEQLESIRGT